ncbi:hypothetical protein MJT46_014330 [Ovis ammon polii x Ovis aries]|nr:hypothetical protein MJT46_014330 [Ovis ammon polii x Ovis aries]
MRDPFAACSGENPGRSRRIARRGALHRKGLRPRHRRERNPQRPASNSHGDWTFLGPPYRVPEVPASIPEDLFSMCCLYFHAEDRLRPWLHVGQLFVKSSCESLEGNPPGKATDPMIDAMASVTLLLQLGRSFTPLLQLKKFPDIPVSTREEARRYRPHPEEPRFRLLPRHEGSFPCLVGKEFWAFPFHLKRMRSPQETRKEHQGRATKPRVPHCLSPFQRTCFPCAASIFMLRIDSDHGGTLDSSVRNPRVKASREILEGKPQIPCSTRWQASHCCYSSGGKHTCKPLLKKRTDFPGETPELPQYPFQHWRGILRVQPRLHTTS